MSYYSNLVTILDKMSLPFVKFSLTTNQGNGVVSYSYGSLDYRKNASIRGPGGWLIPVAPTFSGTKLDYLFSNREAPSRSPEPVLGGRTPFDSAQKDSLGLKIYRPLGSDTIVVKITLESWGSTKLTLTASEMGDLLVGIGPPVGNGVPYAVYTIALYGPGESPK